MTALNYVYKNNGTTTQPSAHSNKNGMVRLLGNVSAAETSDPMPIGQAKRVYQNIFICAETWGGSAVTVEVSPDGVNCWTPLTVNFTNEALTNISTNTYALVVLSDVYIRASVTAGGTNVSVLLS